ncbi:MAG: glycosyltransferase, partial [Candidatus Marinimicrobia bacterium]|nr:glycosyltransferase [Candidatus Neomarinimicrobiota bacterium]
MNGNINILIAGGGTGGHLFPAIAIGEEIQHREPEANIHFVGSTFGLEAKVFPIKDVWHTLLPIRGLQRGFNFISIGRNILLPGRVIHSLIKLRTLFREFSPRIVIGTGGYASALPLYVAIHKKEPVPIVLQEQNSFPGMTTRWFAEKAR